MGPFCNSPGRVLLHLLMVGSLSHVMDKVNRNVVNVNVVKDNVGVLAVSTMHSGNMNKNIKLRYAREVRNNVVYVVNMVKDNGGGGGGACHALCEREQDH
jgi:hypothetical protein